MNDEYARMAEEHQRTYGLPLREKPGFYEGSERYHHFVLDHYHDSLRFMAADLRTEAEQQKQLGHPELAVLVTRIQLHVEELSELVEAMANRDIVGALAELTDCSYVCDTTHAALGTLALKRQAYEIIHASNMSKLGADGKPIVDESGRVVKGPNYRSPKESIRTLLDNFPT